MMTIKDHWFHRPFHICRLLYLVSSLVVPVGVIQGVSILTTEYRLWLRRRCPPAIEKELLEKKI